MKETEQNLERITVGLPEAPIEIPDHILIAYKDGTIKDTDVVHNLYAYIQSTNKSNVQPPLTIHEELARSQAVRTIAQISVDQLL